MSRMAWVVSSVLHLAAWLAVVGFLVTRGEPEADVLRVRGLQVVDEQGVVRVDISVLGDTTQLRMGDGAARTSVTVRTAADGHASVLLSAPSGFVRTDENGVLVSTPRPENAFAAQTSDVSTP
ncbi:MAG: hypothetical protein H6738_05710 [Alphaproteobacteria bacterium]|nr:hypothetical protein [Alphaproteobacteria bacterium]MCB9696265.1 hypothetical protein [Alphaproteobacteria bacterium]